MNILPEKCKQTVGIHLVYDFPKYAFETDK